MCDVLVCRIADPPCAARVRVVEEWWAEGDAAGGLKNDVTMWVGWVPNYFDIQDLGQSFCLSTAIWWCLKFTQLTSLRSLLIVEMKVEFKFFLREHGAISVGSCMEQSRVGWFIPSLSSLLQREQWSIQNPGWLFLYCGSSIRIGQWKTGPWLFRVYWGLFATQLCGYYFISHYFLDPYEKTKIQWNGLVGKYLQVQLGEVVWCPNKSILPSLLETIIFTSPKSDFLSGLDRWSLNGGSREGNPIHPVIPSDQRLVPPKHRDRALVWLEDDLDVWSIYRGQVGKWLGSPRPFISRLQ